MNTLRLHIGDGSLEAWVSVRQELHTPHRSVIRSVITGIMIVASALSVLVATLAVWVHSTALDTGRFVEAVAPVVTDDDVTDAVAVEVTRLVFDLIDLENRVAVGLDAVDTAIGDGLDAAIEEGSVVDRIRGAADLPSLAGFAPLLADELRDRIEMRVATRLRSAELRATFIEMVTVGHRAAVAVIRNDTETLPGVVNADGALTVDLVPVVVGVLGDIADDLVGFVDLGPVLAQATTDPHETVRRVAALTGTQVNTDFGLITVISAERLAQARTTVERFDHMVIWSVVLAAALVIGTVVTSQRRWQTAGWVAMAILAAFALAGLIVNRLQDAALAMIDPEVHVPALAIIGAVVRSAYRIGAVVLVAVLVMLVGSVLVAKLDPNRPSEAARDV